MDKITELYHEETLHQLKVLNKNLSKAGGLELFDHIEKIRGDKGADGVSIKSVDSELLTDKAVITLTLTNNEKHIFEVERIKGIDGERGMPGKDAQTPVKNIDYFDGKDGYTPVKGKDYFDGDSGADGQNGSDGQSIVWRGPWNTNDQYSINDAVEYTGSSYIAVDNNKGSNPTNHKYWNLMAQKGADGISRGGSSSSSGGGGSGNVAGPATSTDNAIARFDGTTGKVLQDYTSNAPTITDNGQVFLGSTGIGPTVTATVLNTYTTDLNSNIILNSFQSTGSVNAAGNVQALQFNVTDTGTNSVGTLQGVNGVLIKSGSGTATNMVGVNASSRLSGTAAATLMSAFASQNRAANGTSVTTMVSFNATASTIGATAVVGAQYGLKIAPMKVTGVTTGYGVAADGTSDINYFLGKVGVGTAAPVASAALEISSTTTGFLPPRMSTAQKTAISSPAVGLMVFDTNLAKLCVFTGSVWETITSA